MLYYNGGNTMNTLELNREIRRLSTKGAYKKVIRLAEEIDWEKERNIRLLPEVVRAYEQVERFVDAEKLLLMAYEKGQTGKGNVYRLIELCAKTGDIKNAERFYQEFIEYWMDSREMMFVEYYMSKLHKAPIKEQIMRLEKCCQESLREEWLYDLTVLYAKDGNISKCISTCHKLIFCFGSGTYTSKAIEIRCKYGELTEEEQEQLFQTKNKQKKDMEREKKQFNPKIDISLLNRAVSSQKQLTEDEIQIRVLEEISELKEEIEDIYEKNNQDNSLEKIQPVHPSETEKVNDNNDKVKDLEGKILEKDTEKQQEKQQETKVEIEEKDMQQDQLYIEKPSKEPPKARKTKSSKSVTNQATVFCSWIRDYARENGAEIEEDMYLKLALFAERALSQGQILSKNVALDLVQSAVNKAREKKIFNFFISRYNQDGRLILKEKHFQLS